MGRAAKRVLVTRPEPGASETAARLIALGLVPLKLPLQEIRPLPVDLKAVEAGIDGARVTSVAITSANAVRHAPGELLAPWLGLPCFVVGKATAQAARHAGFTEIVEGEGNAESLAETVVAYRPSGILAYICGKVRWPHFERRLAEAGLAVTAAETYNAIGLAYDAGEIASAVGREPIRYALVHSANAARSLADMTRRDVSGLFGKMTVICMSRRVAAELEDGRFDILIASEPSETAMLDLLDRHANEIAP